MLSRSEHWWRRHKLADYEHWRHGASKRFNACLELDGEPVGYAVYRVKEDWDNGYPRGEVRLVEAFATSPESTRELWRFLFGIDLTTRVKSELFDPASLDVADLAGAYLGAFSFERLASAGRVDELRPGTLARASALFRTPLPPFCPEEF